MDPGGASGDGWGRSQHDYCAGTGTAKINCESKYAVPSKASRKEQDVRCCCQPWMKAVMRLAMGCMYYVNSPSTECYIPTYLDTYLRVASSVGMVSSVHSDTASEEEPWNKRQTNPVLYGATYSMSQSSGHPYHVVLRQICGSFGGHGKNKKPAQYGATALCDVPR